MNQEIIDKYNVSTPRYTSYPPANYFGQMSNEDYLDAVDNSNKEGSQSLSFYFHMPFCKRLCHYCGCNSYIMPREGQTVSNYIDALHKEIDLVTSHIDKNRPISQIHYGGGSPTAMPASVLRELNDHLFSLFPSIEKKEVAIECHPGYLSAEDWEELTRSHFNRFSIGVQDLDEKVLKTVGRTPSALPLKDIMDILRKAGATVNMDFLFGLPYQTPESFGENIRKAIELRPDRLVTFSYGHVPWVFKRQQTLEKHGLPAPDVKQQMYDKAAEMLHDAGYKTIGLDHFVLPTDELYIALENGQLYRNFQGYCTRRTTGQVYAFGVTGISQLDSVYAQNTKDIDEYIRDINSGNISIRKGYKLSHSERIAKEVIERLMCNYRIEWREIANTLGISVEDVLGALHYDESKLREMHSDGIIELSADGISMTELGHPFVRNVSASLDPLMQNTTKQFSKPI